jgi:hypothetical protein
MKTWYVFGTIDRSRVTGYPEKSGVRVHEAYYGATACGLSQVLRRPRLGYLIALVSDFIIGGCRGV